MRRKKAVNLHSGERIKYGVLASGGGSNLQAVIDACENGKLRGSVSVVIGNNSKAGALERARRHGIPAVHLSSVTHSGEGVLDAAILETLESHGADFVLLLGYMKKLGPKTLEQYRDRVLNIHPALLPGFGGAGMYGRRVHAAVVAAHEKESGPTVHLVDGAYDHGATLAQRRVPVLPDDTPESLAGRVLVQEHILMVETLERIERGELFVSAGEAFRIEKISDPAQFAACAAVIRAAFRTVAVEFSLSRENCPSHPAFIEREALDALAEKGAEFFGLFAGAASNAGGAGDRGAAAEDPVGCIVTERASGEVSLFCIEKLSVVPEYRHRGCGESLLRYAEAHIRERGGTVSSVALIDGQSVLKAWYSRLGYRERGKKTFPQLPFTVCFMRKELV